MNNEEKILNLLEKMHGDITQIQQEQKQMNQRLGKVETELTKVSVTQENTVLPALKLLAEGQTTIQEQIKRLSIVDQLQADVSVLKSAVSYLSSELEQLKKAI